MKILVTGATGFVGASLVRELIRNQEIELYITVRKNSDFWRINQILSKLQGIYYCNLDHKTEVFELIENLKPNVIYHTAAYGGFPNQRESERMISSNLNGTIHLIDAAMKNGVQQFINTGSSSEYGIKHRPMKETDLCEPISLYGVTKLAATNYCTMMGKVHHYKVCTLRLFSPYGELEDSSRLYPTIVNALKNNEQPKLSKPDSVRDFIEIDKVIDVYKRIVNVDFEPGDIINVGSGQQQTISQFYHRIASSMGKNIEPIWGEVPPRQNEPLYWEADITKLRSLLNK
jgi:nucleoside-diphosphate-sugar epimerase